MYLLVPPTENLFKLCKNLVLKESKTRINFDSIFRFLNILIAQKRVVHEKRVDDSLLLVDVLNYVRLLSSTRIYAGILHRWKYCNVGME